MPFDGMEGVGCAFSLLQNWSESPEVLNDQGTGRLSFPGQSQSMPVGSE